MSTNYYKTYGYCLGTHNIPEEKYQRRLASLLGRTTWIRGYAVGGYNAHRIAKGMGYKVAVGAWLGRDLENNESQLFDLIAEAKAGFVNLAIVGSEVLLRNELTDHELAKYVKRFKEAVPGVHVTVCDDIKCLFKAPEVLAACDTISAHSYPYWNGIPIENALHFTFEKHRQLEKLSGKEVIIAETGWPSAGNTIGGAVANPENALRHFKEFVEWATRWNIRYFYFAPFDESWKKQFESEQGAHWGRWYEDGSEKPWGNWK